MQTSTVHNTVHSTSTQHTVCDTQYPTDSAHCTVGVHSMLYTVHGIHSTQYKQCYNYRSRGSQEHDAYYVVHSSWYTVYTIQVVTQTDQVITKTGCQSKHNNFNSHDTLRRLESMRATTLGSSGSNLCLPLDFTVLPI